MKKFIELLGNVSKVLAEYEQAHLTFGILSKMLAEYEQVPGIVLKILAV